MLSSSLICSMITDQIRRICQGQRKMLNHSFTILKCESQELSDMKDPEVAGVHEWKFIKPSAG